MTANRVLIVDDELDVVQSVRFSLELEGFDCLDASDGAEALKLAKRARPDLIILDVMLPAVNGHKVAKLLKFDPACKDIPIIMLTAMTEPKDKWRGVELGADEYVTKPFNMDELVALVTEHLGRETSILAG